jgi:hypothetical protein
MDMEEACYIIQIFNVLGPARGAVFFVLMYATIPFVDWIVRRGGLLCDIMGVACLLAAYIGPVVWISLNATALQAAGLFITLVFGARGAIGFYANSLVSEYIVNNGTTCCQL